ncbi:MtrAB system histidine kinase MtrB [Actinomyces massiliensis]|uniref:MtrAB system histidine kinase MtrB n=1 Tax=Actinomyces massiliensis TaxID=461393 RepID=UPI0003102C39
MSSPGLRRRDGFMPSLSAIRRSLATRMAMFAMVGGIVLIVIILVVVTARIRDDIFADRRDVILTDARLRVATVQAAFDTSGATTADQVAAVAQAQISSVGQSFAGAGGVGVVLKRSGTETTANVINDLTTDSKLDHLVTEDLTTAIADSASEPRQYWKSISVDSGNGSSPGLIVGQRVSLPLAGEYDLFLIYTLAPEQNVIELASRAVVIAGSGFLLMLILGIWALTWRVLIPIRRTSLASQRLAGGRLSERLPVHGEDEIATLSRSFNEMAASLEAQIEAWEKLSKIERLFVSDVSHELRTPLASIRLASEQIWEARDEIEDPFAARSLEILMREIDRFESMLTDLLEISRIDSGRVQLRAEDADIAALTLGVLDLVAVHIEAKGSQVVLDTPPEPVIAEVDSTRIERILRNLIVNAIEHAEGSRIDVTIAKSDDAVAVRVRDHGIGMSPDVVKQVFDRFYRADPSRKRTLGGTGLGLSIALEDAALHGGTIIAWGWPQEGASFLLTLPRHLGPDAGPGSFTEPGPLGVVPDDAPAVARVALRREPEPKPATAPAPVVAPAPASRRAADRAQEDPALVESELPIMPPVPTTRSSTYPRARTPEDVDRRADPGEPR